MLKYQKSHAIAFRLSWLVTTIVVSLFVRTSHLQATELEGLTEPFRTLRLASDETGTIAEVLVSEGDVIRAGQPLVRLNSEIHEAIMAIAAQYMKAEGRILSAQADLQLRQSRLKKLREIRGEGFARQEEVDRATMELEMAQANLHAAKEDSLAKQLEYKKTQVQLSRRTITAPVDGVVTILHKHQGEYVAPNTPEIVTLVQLNSLLANFTLTKAQAATIKKGDPMQVVFPEGGESSGTVEFVSPVIDAESSTILLKVRIDNESGIFRSGQRCRVRMVD
ncbi:MAG: efflux RND transporter periplasmic adaptor subunit, partial [Pirellula sp.]